MMASPVYAPTFAPQAYAASPYAAPPVAWQPAGMPQSPTAVPGPTLAQQPAPRPLVRAKGPDDPVPAAPAPRPPAPLVMPSPEQLGVAPAGSPDGTDWTAARRRLDRLGAVCFHLEQQPQGGYAFTCLLPTTQPGRTHRVEAVAGSEKEVVRLVLDKAEEWAGSR